MNASHNNIGREPRMPAPEGIPPLLHSDNRLLVFSKPPGLLSVPGIGPAKADCLASRAAEEFPGARIIHRLDRDTSGVIVLARDAEAHRNVSIQFQERHVEKHYEAVVGGRVAIDNGVIDAALRKDLDNPPRQIIDEKNGRDASTRFVVLERYDDSTRVELLPRTGRSHQLRVHMLSIGHPILGDDLYAPLDLLNASPRLLLHATILTITHPSSGQELTFFDPCPF
jgi:tRNA pseudouridine32 synthase / 23S rRNA pseudouridine746 synthase